MTYRSLSDASGKLLILDGHNVALRSYHALIKQTELLKNKAGEGTWGVYGFFTTLVHFVNRIEPDRIAIAFDWGQSEKRLAMFPEYKGNRKFKIPEEVSKRQESRRQVEVIIKLLGAFGIPVLREKNVEADDIIAKIVKSSNDEIVIVSGDHDLRQLVSEKVIVVKPSIGVKPEDIYDKERILNTYGIDPSRLPEIWALTGDTSDNIQGIPGVGEKTAIELIKQYGSLNELLNSEEQKLKNNKENAILAYKIINLDGSFCNITIPNLDFNPVKPGKQGADVVLEMLEALDFNSIKFKWITGKLWESNNLSVGRHLGKNNEAR